MDKINLQVVRESFGKVAYTHKTHEKDAEILSRQSIQVKWVNIILTTLTSGTLISTIITSEASLSYIGSILSAITLAFVVFQLSFNPEANAEKHRQLAKELWYVRERYVSLIADILGGKLNEDTIVSRRNQLIDELKWIYKFAPNTSSKAYKQAQEALQIKEELSFSEDEIDRFLPVELRLKK